MLTALLGALAVGLVVLVDEDAALLHEADLLLVVAVEGGLLGLRLGLGDGRHCV